MCILCTVALMMMLSVTEIGSAAMSTANSDAVIKPASQNIPRDTGTVVLQFAGPSTNVDGLTWDGANLWIGSDGLDRIYKMDTLGNLLDSFPAPNTTATGMCYDGQYLWCANGGSPLRIYRLDPATGNIVDSIPGPGGGSSCEGLAWMNDTLWNTNWSDNIVWRLNPVNGSIFGQFAAPGSGSTGLTWDDHDNALWLSDQILGIIYKLNPTTGAVIMSFTAPDAAVQDLVFDGMYLWTCGWYSGTVYKMDIGYTGIEEYGSLHPSAIALRVSPNPSRGTTHISYEIGDNAGTIDNAFIRIYDASGRQVESFDLASQTSWAGTDGTDRKLPSGVYFLRLQVGDYTATAQLLLVR